MAQEWEARQPEPVATLTRRSLGAGDAATGATALIGPATAAQATPAGSPTVGATPVVAASPVAGAAPARRFGFVLSHEQFRTPELVENGVLAEQAGFDELWTSEHWHPWQDNQGYSTHPWRTQALLGGSTSRVAFGTGVTCPTYRHHPAEVARAFASLGILAPGRGFLGVGAGEAPNEPAATGAFGRYQERADRLVGAVTLIRQLWTGEPITFEGASYKTTTTRLYDLPEQPVPLYLAASGPKSARIAGEHADGRIMGAKDILKPELHDAFRQGAEAAGEDPDSLPKIVEALVVVGDQAAADDSAQQWRFTVDAWNPGLLSAPDPRSIRRKAEQMFPLEQVLQDAPVGEDPAVHVQAMRMSRDAGATTVFVHSGQCQEEQARVIEFYGSRVLPQPRQG